MKNIPLLLSLSKRAPFPADDSKLPRYSLLRSPTATCNSGKADKHPRREDPPQIKVEFQTCGERDFSTYDNSRII
jgi:hypothetical protein